MRKYDELLSARSKELTSHLSLIVELNSAAIARLGFANLQIVEMEHVEILKSGFLVHLYNVVEAVMDVILSEVAMAAVAYPPRRWSGAVQKEWVKARGGIEDNLGADTRVSRIMDILGEAHGDVVGVNFQIKSRGNWSNKEIERLCLRLGCPLIIDGDVSRLACFTPFQDDMPPMKYLRHKRNGLAHGSETFASGAIQLTPGDLKRLREPVLSYMSAVVASFTQYLDNQSFLHENAAP